MGLWASRSIETLHKTVCLSRWWILFEWHLLKCIGAKDKRWLKFRHLYLKPWHVLSGFESWRLIEMTNVSWNVFLFLGWQKMFCLKLQKNSIEMINTCWVTSSGILILNNARKKQLKDKQWDNDCDNGHRRLQTFALAGASGGERQKYGAN